MWTAKSLLDLSIDVKAQRRHYLEGHGDLVSGFRMGIIGVIIWLIGVINLVSKST